MIKRRKGSSVGKVKVSFVLAADDPRLPASVVGSFNGWTEGADPFRRRSNETASAVVELDAGKQYRFRYQSADGSWFDEDSADAYRENEFGSTDCILQL